MDPRERSGIQETVQPERDRLIKAFTRLPHALLLLDSEQTLTHSREAVHVDCVGSNILVWASFWVTLPLLVPFIIGYGFKGSSYFCNTPLQQAFSYWAVRWHQIKALKWQRISNSYSDWQTDQSEWHRMHVRRIHRMFRNGLIKRIFPKWISLLYFAHSLCFIMNHIIGLHICTYDI